MSLEFDRPEMLYLLLLLPAWWLLVWPWTKGGVMFSRGESARPLAGSWHLRAAVLVGLPRLLRMGALASLIVALAHPQSIEIVPETALRGKGIALAVDISTSMLAQDMEDERSRLTVARDAAVRFAEGRELDEIGLVAFAGQAVTRVPPTSDAGLIVAGVESLEVQLVLDGTDISAAMLTSTALLMDSDSEDRVIVLLTDGAHNGSGAEPLVTARAAAAFGVRVHSIALLSDPDLAGVTPALRGAALARQGRIEAEMETVLTGISRITGGTYFRASTGAALDSAYSQISRLEAPVEQAVERIERRSRRAPLLFLALFFIGLDAAVRGSRWGLVP